MAEVLKVELVMKNGRRDLVIVYIPSKTSAWERELVMRHIEKYMQMFKEYDGKQCQHNYDGRFQLQKRLLGRMVYWRRRSSFGDFS